MRGHLGFKKATQRWPNTSGTKLKDLNNTVIPVFYTYGSSSKEFTKCKHE